MGNITPLKVRYHSNGIVEATQNGSTMEVYRFPFSELTPGNDTVQIDNNFIVYILYAYNDSGKDKIYVGKSKNGIYGRPRQHQDKFNADICYILTENVDNTFFNDGIIQYLEHRLSEKINDNKNRYNNTTEVTETGTVNTEEKEYCNKYLKDAEMMLRVLGLDLPIEKIPPEPPIDPRPNKHKLPELPEDDDMRVGEFVKLAVDRLVSSNFVFSDELLDWCGNADEMFKFTKQNIPMFWLLTKEKPKSKLSKKIAKRYWADVYSINGRKFLMFNGWYGDESPNGAKKKDFIDWYYSLEKK